MSSEKVDTSKKQSRSSRCQVRNCTRDPNVSLHRLPKNNFFRRKWIKKLNITEPCDTFYVCQLHFAENDFSEGAASRRRLLHNAVPSVNLPPPPNEPNEVLEISTDDDLIVTVDTDPLLLP